MREDASPPPDGAGSGNGPREWSELLGLPYPPPRGLRGALPVPLVESLHAAGWDAVAALLVEFDRLDRAPPGRADGRSDPAPANRPGTP